ncbi:MULTISPECIES: vitamin K epoxide reductase family protein [unclassified Streptomyces]|uniref:vitamin K epoxide reductase family protein n=1 Tax=unclassified Streptomyces TaxID=2593676 RepID=UPI0016607A00|nr:MULTISPECIES: vitamin K epoxide reductase family protein [unclassified Streptomyces]MBD0710431.1 Vitamin K epoxide reductase [Streptomyces sp. CBMA291]MBD0712766.1 Vitamin K epoxide reductase [Streptomyces sp. CBMA370]
MTTVLHEPVVTAAEAPPRERAVGATRAFAWLLVVTGGLGVLASWVITLDKFLLLADPGFVPGCNISPVISCGSVMTSDQASVFGFPNPMLGLVAYGVVVAVGAGLLAGARYGRWFWLGLNLGTLLGVGFCMWLMSQALYEIGALCLWCCLAWAVTIVMFWYTTVHNLRHGVLRAPRQLVAAAVEFHWFVPVAWCGSVLMLIGTRFQDYWSSLL